MIEFWNNSKTIDLWRLRNSNSFMKLILINQMKLNNIILEFGINANSSYFKDFIEKLKEIVIKKNPSGSLSSIGHLSQDIENKSFINTQFKKYRIEFVDSFIDYKEEDLKQKSEIFYNNLINLLGTYERKKINT